MLGVNLGIDLGTANIRIFSSKKGIVLEEPTILAENTNDSSILAYGHDAYEMLGRTPPSIKAIRPLQDGAVSEYSYAKKLLKTYIKKVCSYRILKPKVIISVPKTLTNIEERSVVEVALSAGARNVVLMQESVLSAIGAGIDITAPVGNMVINIGAGCVDIAVLSLNDLVVSQSWKIGGYRMDKDIETYIHNKYSLSIGDLMAEKVKVALGNAIPLERGSEERTFVAKGYNNISELPDQRVIRESEIYQAISVTIFSIMDIIQQVLEITPPELAADIMENGIVLCGGGALIKNMAVAIEKYIGVPCKLAENPEKCVIYGAGKALKIINKLSSGAYDISEVNFPLSNLIDL